MAMRLIAGLEGAGVRAGFIKRTHHALDLPEKSSARIWGADPSAMLFVTPDRAQLTLPPADRTVAELVGLLPAGLDVVVLETHTPEPYPTILWAGIEPEADEWVVGRWTMVSIEADAASALLAAMSLLPGRNRATTPARLCPQRAGRELESGTKGG